MTHVRFALLALLLPMFNAFGADEAGSFAMKGAGFLPCKVYTNEREKRSNVYYMIGGWIEGYVTAHNKYVADTYDVLSFESLELLLAVIDNHCRAKPDDLLYSVVNSMVIKLQPSRLQHQSRRVPIERDERKTTLYRETIRRIQRELAARGLYKDEITGVFDDATKAAIIAFQSDSELEMTGFPDQTTLWRLLRK